MHSNNAIVYLDDDIYQDAHVWLEAMGYVPHRARSQRDVGRLCDAYRPAVVVLEGPLSSDGEGVHLATWLRRGHLACPILFRCGSQIESRALESETNLGPFETVVSFTSSTHCPVLEATASDCLREIPEHGSLSQWSLGDVLLNCMDQQWTGRIELEHGSTSKSVFVESGTPVYCSSNIFSENFGQMLLREGVISEVEYEWARKIQLREGIRQGEALVKVGVMSSRQLHDHLQAQIRQKLVNAFGWTEGTFQRVPDESFLHHTTRFQFNPIDIVVAGRARFLVRDDIHALWERMGNHWAVCISEQGHVGDSVNQWLEERAARALLHPTMLSEVAIDCGWTKPFALSVFLVLESVGYVRVSANRQSLPAVCPVTPVRFDEVEIEGETYLEVDVLESASAVQEMNDQQRAELADDLWSAYLNLTSIDHFEALGVDVDASAAEIMAARDELLEVYDSSAFAPVLDDQRSANALSEIHSKLTAAASVLLNVSSRADYVERLTRIAEREVSQYLTAEDEFVEGMVKLNTGDFEGAREHFRTSRQFNNQEPVYEMYYGWAVYCAASDEGEVEIAKRHLIRAISINPLMDDGYVMLGKVLLHQGDAAEAAEQARTALAFNPGNEDARALLTGLEDGAGATLH